MKSTMQSPKNSMKRKNSFFLLFFLILTALSSCNSHSPTLYSKPASAEQSYNRSASSTAAYDYSKAVLLISLDGFRPDYISESATPVLFSLTKSEAFASQGMNPSFPTLTFPNHYTIVTGLRPEHHGIVANEIKDPNIPQRFKLGVREITNDPRWWLGEPLWVSAQKQGLKSGTMFWPGSEAEIQGVRPTYYLPYDGNKPRADRVAQFFSWLDLPENARPNFFTLYFEDVDSAGHKFGPSSREVKKAANDLDATLGSIIDGLKERNLWDKINVVIVADHGMTAVEEKKRIGLFSILNGYPKLESIGGGSMLGIFTSDPAIRNELIKKINAASPLIKAYKKENLPARLYYSESPRIPDIVVLAEESAFVSSKETPYSIAGAHGYDPNLQSMKALFIAHGPAFKTPASVPPFDNVDVYPALCKVLGIKPAANDGSLNVLGKILK